MNINNQSCSILTVVLNRVETIGDAIASVKNQTYASIEHVIIDGGSTDGTLEIIKDRLNKNDILLSEKDNGLYDALNKGIKLASGDVIGLMHSDDFYSDDHVISDIMQIFANDNVDAVYADLEYVSKSDNSKVIRRWIAGSYNKFSLILGWMPPHPTVFLRRSVLEEFGGYDTRFKISGDYDAILRYFANGRIASGYMRRVAVKMRLGGESNKSIRLIIRKSYEDYLALRKNGVGGLLTLCFKNLRKIRQFVC